MINKIVFIITLPAHIQHMKCEIVSRWPNRFIVEILTIILRDWLTNLRSCNYCRIVCYSTIITQLSIAVYSRMIWGRRWDICHREWCDTSLDAFENLWFLNIFLSICTRFWKFYFIEAVLMFWGMNTFLISNGINYQKMPYTNFVPPWVWASKSNDSAYA